jgi:hypothetical protein
VTMPRTPGIDGGKSARRTSPTSFGAPQDADDTSTTAQKALLRANSAAYERLVRVAQDRSRGGDADGALRAVSRAAQFCSAFHTGRFADGAIENIAFEIGKSAAGNAAAAQAGGAPRTGRRVLHVISQVSSVGGHTRMLYHWLRNDRTSSHGIAVVQQGDRPIPRWLSQTVQDSGGQFTVCDRLSPQQARATIVRRLARRDADLVVLHHDGDDIVPILAFANEGGPPVAVLNHADHSFWLGSSVADAVIDLRSVALGHSAERRYARRSVVLPIPLANTPAPMTRPDARRSLGIPADQRVLLTIGRRMKFRPCGSYDFLRTACQILERDRPAHLYVVGASENDMAPYFRGPRHERIHFVGTVDDPSPYRSAADVYLESFPFGSNTALLEAALAGLAVVPAYAPLFPLLVAGNDSLQSLLSNPPSERAYVERACELSRDAVGRVAFGTHLRERVRLDHLGDGWLDRLASLYRCTDALVHRPAPIPATTCTMSEADIGLSLWNVIADGKTKYREDASLQQVALLRHAAFVAKHAGDYTGARWLALRAVLAGPIDTASWRLLAASALGHWGPLARSWLRRNGVLME